MPATRQPTTWMQRAKIEAVCLGRTLMPDDDSLERTLATLTLFGVWAVAVLGPMFVPEANPLVWELQLAITAMVFLILGRMWDLEVERVLDGVTISTDGGRPEDLDDDRED